MMSKRALILICAIAAVALWRVSPDVPRSRALVLAALRDLPVPTADVSPQVQRQIASRWSPSWDVRPADAAQWREIVRIHDAGGAQALAPLRARYGVKVEPTTVAGVKAYVVTPATLAPERADRLLIAFHGGGYVFGAGEGGTREAIMMAGIGGYRVLAVDYRMPPDAPFPAALDDAVAVWRETIKSVPAKNIAVFGTSAGGGLALATVLLLKDEKLPLPAAVGAGTPWSDLDKIGDSYFVNEGVDNSLVSWDGTLEAAARLYAAGGNLKDPYLSPVYGDFAGFPPTIFTVGGRDLFLSNAVRTHRKMRRAGVDADLNVYEGMSHAGYFDPDAPETREAFSEIARFFDARLGR